MSFAGGNPMTSRDLKSAVVAVLLLGACSPSSDPPGTNAALGAFADGGRAADAGASDADAGPGPLDAGLPDAGTPCTCSAGVCLADGGCGQCAADADCPLATPACDLPTNRCAVCSATNNTCGAGRRCVGGACGVGCLTGADCASGVCLASNACLNCQGDVECAPGLLCGTGHCAAPCTTTCGAGWTCCQGRCVDEARDPLNCGACGVACAADAFCGRAQCHGATLSNLCAMPVACTVLNGVYEDDAAGLAITYAITGSCTSPVTSRIADAGAVDVATGAPLPLGELSVLGGGSFRQRAIAWLEDQNLATVRDTSTEALYRYSLRDGGTITSAPRSAISPMHDIFVIQLVRLPSGVVVFNAAGFYAQGTTSAAWYFINRQLGSLTTQTDSWYVVDWTDTNANLHPDPVDTWTLVASGR